jgi:hypothetical protein
MRQPPQTQKNSKENVSLQKEAPICSHRECNSLPFPAFAV